MGWGRWDEEEKGKRENIGIGEKASKEGISSQGDITSHSPAFPELHPT